MIVANVGSSNSGKSTFSAAEAFHLVEKCGPNTSCILISFNMDTPMRAVWEPSERISQMYSLGHLLEEEIIDAKTLPKYVVTHKNHPNLGLLGYCAGDTPLDFSDIHYEKILSIIKAAEQMASVVIIDCDSTIWSDIVAASLEMADCLNLFLTPDSRGILYEQTFTDVYSKSPKFAVSNTHYILSPAKKFNAIQSFGEALGGKPYMTLPYSLEIEVLGCEGKLFETYNKAPKAYRKVVETINQSLTY